MVAHVIPRGRWQRTGPRMAFVAALGLGLASALTALLVFASPSSDVPRPVRLTIPAEDVPAPGGQPLRVADGRFFLVNLRPGEGTHFRGLPGEGGLLALFWKDPHLGCTVTWRPDMVFQGRRGWFRNPCHGETYTKAGVKVFGAAPRSMDTYPLEVRADGRVIVNTTVAMLGADDNPARAVPYSPN